MATRTPVTIGLSVTLTLKKETKGTFYYESDESTTGLRPVTFYWPKERLGGKTPPESVTLLVK